MQEVGMGNFWIKWKKDEGFWFKRVLINPAFEKLKVES